MIINNDSEPVLNLPVDIGQYKFWYKLCALSYVESVYLFGSRARGDGRCRSDIDIAVNCPDASLQEWQEILNIIEYADTLLGIDLVRYDSLGDSLFKRKIDESKVVIYER
ncbi:MAG: nucleotidyltransferase domain-containing protein [Gammaproteobacteria bacterium]|nr:nucleotidyltransferase domain-containing protein [Gammaproteobacteria bacterium]